MSKTKSPIKNFRGESMGLEWLFEDTPPDINVPDQKYDLEHDLKLNEFMLQKVCDDVAYAQNLYAALCNIEWCKNAVVSILKEEYWSCSWRHAGAIVADMRQQGDYIDWYCSGISVFVDMDDNTFDSLTPSQREMYHTVKRYVQEGFITDEVRADIFQMGWIPVDYTPKT